MTTYELESEFEQLEEETGYAESSDAGPWTGNAEQVQFRADVLNAHIARLRARRGAASPDLTPGQLKTVPGTPIQMRTDAAVAAGNLLAAAKTDLAAAQAAGDADAMKTVGLSANSGYRSSEHQRKLWLGYFSGSKGYYNGTRKRRASIADGPHSARAVAYMLDGFGIPNRIAAPGYSNHQGGIAIDFQQIRTKGSAISNSYGAQQGWRSSWFFNWLNGNAARFGFKPYTKEAWHWEFRPGAAREASFESAPAGSRAYLGGQINTITPKSLSTRVTVFCPKAALGKSEVDVLVYAHGLLGVCESPRPGKETEDMVTSKPFQFGQWVNASGRPVVLVIPFFGRPWDTRGLSRPANLNQMIREALAETGRMRGGAPPSLGRLILSGHSRAFSFFESLAAYYAGKPKVETGPLAKLSEVWAFDTTYACNVNNWMDWLKNTPGLTVSMFYRTGTKTAGCGKSFLAKRNSRLRVTPVNPSEGHCEVPGRRIGGLLNAAAGNPESEMEIGQERYWPDRPCRCPECAQVIRG